MGEIAEAQPLLEEAIAGLRLTTGGGDKATLNAMSSLAVVHTELHEKAKARLLYEEAASIGRRTQPGDPTLFEAIGNLGTAIADAGEFMAGLALAEEAATSVQRELGPAHSCTQKVVGDLAKMHE